MYKRIFWLDDELTSFPIILDDVRALGGDIADVRRRVTFATDFEDGVRVLREKKFDLHILDGDFPDRLDERRREEVKKFYQETTPRDIASFRRGVPENIRDNNFARFYHENRGVLEGSTVVCSLSYDVPWIALALGIPFFVKQYAKRPLERADVLKRALQLGTNEQAEAAKRNFSQWESGNLNSLITTHLL